MSDENIVKKVCRELNLTYKQLGELIGYSEGALKSAVNSGNVSEPMKKAIELYNENLKLKNELQDFRTLKDILKR